jgi:hypothetical protein
MAQCWKRISWKCKCNNTVRLSRLVDKPASYSRSPGFKSRYGDRLCWLRVFVVLNPSSLVPGQYLKLDHDRFLPYPFQSIIHWGLAVFWDAAPCSLVDVDRRFKRGWPRYQGDWDAAPCSLVDVDRRFKRGWSRYQGDWDAAPCSLVDVDRRFKRGWSRYQGDNFCACRSI